MKETDIYNLIILEKFTAVNQALEETALDDCSRFALKTLSLCRKGDYSQARGLISKIDESLCNRFSESVLLEAKMLIAIKEDISLDKVTEIADKILFENPSAVYARVIKSQGAFKLGNIQSGIDYILSIGEDHPEVKWIYSILVNFLGATKQYSTSQKYIRMVEPTFRRILYNILVKVLLPLPNKIFWTYTVLILFVGFNSLLSYWFLILMIPLLVFVFYGIIKKDRFIYAGFFSTSIIIFVLFILISALK